jgi:hypothetical protein
MKKVKVTLGDMRFTTKPVGSQVGELQNELKRLGTTEISPRGLLYAVGQDGRSFKPAIYKENSNLFADDFLQTEIIGIDIDAKKDTKKGDFSWYKLQDTLDILHKYELDFLGIYKSFSYTEDEQCHRILFQLPVPVFDDNMYYFVNMLFNQLFPADEACFDKARMFYGGSKGVIEGTTIVTGKPLNLGNLFYAVINKMRETSENHFNRTVETFCTKANLNMVNGLPDVDIMGLEEYMSNGQKVANHGTLYNITIDDATARQKINISDVQILVPHFTADIVIQSIKKGNKQSGKQSLKVKKGNKPERLKFNYGEERYPLDQLKDECELFGAVTNGFWAYHEQLKILVWNFHKVKGAMDALVTALLPYEKKDKSVDYRYKVGNLVSSALKGDYEPANCNAECPYFDDCKIMKSGFKAPYHYISANRIKPIERIPDNERFKVLSSVTNENGDLPHR